MWLDAANYIRGMGSSGVKGQPSTAVAEAGVEDTGSDGYQRSEEEGGRKEGIRIQLG